MSVDSHQMIEDRNAIALQSPRCSMRTCAFIIDSALPAFGTYFPCELSLAFSCHLMNIAGAIPSYHCRKLKKLARNHDFEKQV